VQSTPSLYRVIDYLIVVPDPRKISRMDLEGIMTGAWPTAGLASGNGDRREPELLAPAIESALNAEKGRLRWFFITSWDVRVRQS